jgi:glutamate 5-kinase
MASKVRAAKIVAAEGIDTIIANGRYPLVDVLNQKVPRTLFRAASALPAPS